MTSLVSPVASALRRVAALAALFVAGCLAQGADAPATKPALKVLLLVGGGYHDYEKLAPHLAASLPKFANLQLDVKFGIHGLRDPKFADAYDAILYDVCFDEAPDEILDNAMRATRDGKPSVMLHCAVHAFRKSPKVHDWEACCGMRSKVHDPYEPFTVAKLDDGNPITKQFPDNWRTEGDELYQTISIPPDSKQLLRVKSPKDGREHIVCWTHEYGKSRVFATTLGHDMKTSATPEYLRLVANGLLWVCGKLEADGSPSTGYAAASK
jgi:type 1 glutamine amidotransferase